MATRILFLAAHLQPFLASGIRSLLQHHDVEILVYCQKREENELIDITPGEKLRLFTYDYDPETFFWKTVDLFKPDIVFCAGWMFRMYLGWCATLRKKGARTICAMDTQWKGTFKQKALVFSAPFTIRKYFTHAWVPGNRQEDYAKRLSFSADHILRHLYAPDTNLFNAAYKTFTTNKLTHFPKRFLYAGRLEPHKLKNLLEAFNGLSAQELRSWRLMIVGNGPMDKSPLLKNVAIDHIKALPQKGLADLAAQNGVFCLCSAEEPWGTVAQEFAAAGMPLILSEQCGSSDHFLNGNGFTCDGNSVESIKKALLGIIELSDQQLFQMAENSHRLGIVSNSDTWAKEIIALA